MSKRDERDRQKKHREQWRKKREARKAATPLPPASPPLMPLRPPITFALPSSWPGADDPHLDPESVATLSNTSFKYSLNA